MVLLMTISKCWLFVLPEASLRRRAIANNVHSPCHVSMLKPPPCQKTTWRLAHTAQRFMPLLALKFWSLLSEHRDTLRGTTGWQSWRVIWSRRVNPQHPHTSCGRWSLVRGESGLVMTSKEYNYSMENANMSEFVPINVIPTIWSIASVQCLGDESSLFLLCVRSCPSGGGRNCSKHDNPLIVHPVVFCIFYLCKTLSSS